MKHFELIDQISQKGVSINTQKSDIKIHSPMAVNYHVLEVSPLSIKCPSLRWDTDAEYEAIKWAIDFDKWQHSWHNEIKPENYIHFLEIIQGKVIEKAEQLTKLNSVAIFLANKIAQLEQDSPGSLVKIDIKQTTENFLW